MMTNFPNGASSWGIPLGGNTLPTTFGTIYFVDYDNGSDGNSVKSNSMNHAFKTVAKAYDTVTTNKNDVIALSAYSEHALTEMLTVSKNRVHFVGLDCAGRMMGQGAKISLGVTSAATDLGAVLNTGVRNSFRNIKFSSTNTQAASLYTFLDGGEYMYMDHCEIYKETDLDETTASEFIANGDTAYISNTTIGTNALALVGDVIRANVRVTAAVAGTGLTCRDNVFKNCTFLKVASHVNNRFVYGANAGDVVRMLLLDGCLFFSQKASGAVPAQCVAFGAQQTIGYCFIRNCDSIGNTKLSTTTGVYVSGPVPTYATTGIAVAA
jgi:hypothetical protein